MISEHLLREIEEHAFAYTDMIIQHRRNLHRIPECGWEETATTEYIRSFLLPLGYSVTTGTSVAGRDTGLAAELKCGEGPVLALRFDIDALPVTESTSSQHTPAKMHFRSQAEGRMHACGHDGHMAIGLGCAKTLTELKTYLHGTVRLLFQPAEEGCRGAAPMTEHGWLDTADYFLAGHIVGREYGDENDMPVDCITGVSGSLATTKINVLFKGHSCHGAHPESGASAISALCSAVIALNAIPRNSKGATLLNVGRIEGGEGRNIIAGHASMELEVRGETTELNKYMEEKAFQIIRSNAEMFNCTCEINIAGTAPSLVSSPDLRTLICSIASSLPGVKASSVEKRFAASEDAATMMEYVKSRGGKAAYLLFPADTAAPLHSCNYDFDESILAKATAVYTAVTCELLH